MSKQYSKTLDIEKNKKLFEYEMTEVLLMLKGEFSSVNASRGINYKEVFDENKLHISIKPLPGVDYSLYKAILPQEVKCLGVEFPDISAHVNKFDFLNYRGMDFSSLGKSLPEVDLERISILNLNNSSTIKTLSIDEVDFSIIKLEVPHIPNGICGLIDNFGAEVSVEKNDKIDFSIPIYKRINLNSKISLVEKQIDIIDIPHVSNNDFKMPEVEVDFSFWNMNGFNGINPKCLDVQFAVDILCIEVNPVEVNSKISYGVKDIKVNNFYETLPNLEVEKNMGYLKSVDLEIKKYRLPELDINNLLNIVYEMDSIYSKNELIRTDIKEESVLSFDAIRFKEVGKIINRVKVTTRSFNVVVPEWNDIEEDRNRIISLVRNGL